MVLIPQLHNGDTVSQRLGQTGCPSGESESLGLDMLICQEHQQCSGDPGLDSLEPQAGPAVLAILSASSGFPTPPCQWGSQISRLNQVLEILDAWDVRMSKFLNHLSLVPYLLPPCSFLNSTPREVWPIYLRLHVEGRSMGLRPSFCARRHAHAGRW